MKKLFTILLIMSLVGFEVPHNVTIPDNAVGVWECPSLGTVSPLYESKWDAQGIVDDDESAWFGSYGSARIICDHADSNVGGGVWNVNQMQVGGTAFLHTREGIFQYKCYMICEADSGYSIYSMYGKQLYAHSSTDIVCASCATPDGERVYLAFYEFIGEMP